MKENVGRVDQIVRGVVGSALLAAGLGPLAGRRGEPLGLFSMVLGALTLESAVTRVCPMNRVLGFDTRSKEEVNRDLRALGKREISGEWDRLAPFPSFSTSPLPS